MGQFDSNSKFSLSFVLFPFFFILKALKKEKKSMELIARDNIMDKGQFCKSHGPWPPGPPPPAPMLSFKICGKNGLT